ncbi:MAG: HAD-IC family P-type ATPase [bacterium]|nr:HAD-IC family P-type ATPase [bacterium]
MAPAIKENAPKTITQEDIRDLAFVGFVGMKDALRPEVKDAMQRAVSAGIRVVMITGDHKLTAQAIAKETEIYRDGDEALTGSDIDSLSDDELSRKLDKVSVFARVTPDHKLRIINTYRHRGEVVAMTGDGVNDAPSLVAADLGVAMGKIGTEVAKEAADIVLLDDNFGSIISAVEEGRSIYKTIQKALLFLFSTAIGEVLIITAALFIGVFTQMPLPLLAVHILWVNMVGDGILGIFFSYDPKEKGLLLSTWKKPSKYILDTASARRLFLMAVVMAAGTLFVFWTWYKLDYAKALTMTFTVLAMFQWFSAWNCRSERYSLFTMNPLRNVPMVLATFGVVFLQLLAIYNPIMQKILRTTELLLYDWMIIVPVAASIVLVEEIRKFFYRRKVATLI